MKLKDTISIMQAGGPGSGRHPSTMHEALTMNGWKRAHTGQGGNTYTHPKIKGNVLMKEGGAWKHSKFDSSKGPGNITVGRGKGVDSLNTHLSGIKAFALSTGDQVVSYMDVRPTFHPPSLKNPQRVPSDQPGETDDRFLDVTKRKSKETERRRRQLTKNSRGQPVSVRTTLVEPGTYVPLDRP